MNSNNKEDAYANMENYKHYLNVKLKGGGLSWTNDKRRVINGGESVVF